MSGDDERGRDDAENLSTVGSGGLDELFDELESTVESLAAFADDVENVRRRIAANEGETSGHVRNRIDQDAGQLAAELDQNAERLRERLDELKRSV